MAFAAGLAAKIEPSDREAPQRALTLGARHRRDDLPCTLKPTPANRSTAVQPRWRSRRHVLRPGAADGGPIKIGRTTRYSGRCARLGQIQIGNPHALVVRKVVEGNQEERYHYRYRWIRGEWFTPHRRLADFCGAKAADIPAESLAIQQAYNDGFRAGWSQASEGIITAASETVTEAVRDVLTAASAQERLKATGAWEQLQSGAPEDSRICPLAGRFAAGLRSIAHQVSTAAAKNKRIRGGSRDLHRRGLVVLGAKHTNGIGAVCGSRLIPRSKVVAEATYAMLEERSHDGRLLPAMRGTDDAQRPWRVPVVRHAARRQTEARRLEAARPETETIRAASPSAAPRPTPGDRLSVNQLAERVYERAGFKTANSCGASIYKGWAALLLPCRDRIEAVRLVCVKHGLAPREARVTRRVRHVQAEASPP